MKSVNETKAYEYICYLIELTFGFTPKIEVIERVEGLVNLSVDGTKDEKKQMMGLQANTFHAIKRLCKVFAKNHGFDIYFYIKNEKDFTDFTDTNTH